MDFRPPTPADADEIVAMLVAADIVDFGAPDYDHDALFEEWGEPGFELARDAFITDGAYGLVLRGDARGWVHPDRRGDGLEGALAERLEARARERGLEHVDWQVPRRDAALRAALEARGWEFVRAYADLRLPDTAVDGLPGGEGVRPYDPVRDETAVQELMERCLAAEDAGRVLPLESVLAKNPDTSLWFAADAPDGSLAGAVRCELRPTGFIEGYVRELAVEPAHRGRGIGSALLGAAARELIACGAVGVRLHVRSSNPQALHLYQRLGFAGDWAVDEYRLRL
jgi:ribosomal protein S18 acetylase RimI-like enzyme